MGRVGSCFDYAVAAATFSTITVEYVHRRQFRTPAEARPTPPPGRRSPPRRQSPPPAEAPRTMATWTTAFYNRRRRQCVCYGPSPIDYERSTAQALEAQAA